MIKKIFFLLLSAVCFSIYSAHFIPVENVHIQSDREGYPEISAIKELMVRKFFNPAYQDEISVQIVSGGYYTQRMYLVEMLDENGQSVPMFYLKISKQPHSARKLLDIARGPIGLKIFSEIYSKGQIPENIKESLPVVRLPVAIFRYVDNQGQDKNIEVSSASKGVLVKTILDNMKGAQIQECALFVGRALSAFHQLFMQYDNVDDARTWKAICQGDFTIKNILYDRFSHRVYFIDNEDMGMDSISKDLKPILTGLFMFQYLGEGLKYGYKMSRDLYQKRWKLYKLHCLSFLDGYINLYPEDKRWPLAIFIKHTLQGALDEIIRQRIVEDHGVWGQNFNEPDFEHVIFGYLDSFNPNNHAAQAKV